MPCEILQRIDELSQPVCASGPWGFLRPKFGLRELRATESAVRQQLEREFGQSQLTEAGVLTPGIDGELALAPVLAGDRPRFLPLRESRGAPPYDLVSGRGRLTCSDPAIFDCPRDAVTQAWGKRLQRVLATFCDDDLHVLRSLGIPAVPAAGLSRMDGAQVRRLFGPQDRLPLEAVPPIRRQYWHVTLVGWQIASLNGTAAEEFHSVVSRLEQAASAYDFNVDNLIEIWRPDDDELRDISATTEFADTSRCADQIRMSLDRSTYTLREHRQREAARRNAGDYRAASEALDQALTSAREFGFQSSAVRKRLEEFTQAFDAAVVRAIVDDAMASADPVERSLLLAASELMRIWHRTSELSQVAHAHEAGIAHREQGLHPAELRDKLRLVDGLVKIHRELVGNK